MMSTGSKTAHPEGHHRHRRDAAQDEDAIGAGLMHGVDGGPVVALALDRRRERVDVVHAGNARRDDAHLGRAEHRVAPARDVAPHRLHRDMPVAEDHAGLRLDLQWQHGRKLGLREPAHVGLAERRVRDQLRVEPGDGLIDLVAAELEFGWVPVIEPEAVPANGVQAVLLQVEEHLRDDARRFRIFLEEPVAALFEYLHGGFPSCWAASATKIWASRSGIEASAGFFGQRSRPAKAPRFQATIRTSTTAPSAPAGRCGPPSTQAGG